MNKKPQLWKIDTKTPSTDKDLNYLLLAQIAIMVTGNDTIEVNSAGLAFITGTKEQQKEIQELYNEHYARFTAVMSSYFAVYVRQHQLYHKEPLAIAG